MKTPRRIYFILFAGILFLLILIYFQIFSASFLPWDDDYNITLNPYFLQGQWLELWRHTYFGMYIPVTNTIWELIFNFGGGQSMPFRIFNFLLHLLNTFLVYELVRLWFSKKDFKPGWLLCFAPLVFALHPLQVDAVAWISGGRDLLATFFGLISLLVFFRIENWKGYWLASIFFILSLLSKPQLAALPLVVFTLSLLQDPFLWKRNSLKMLLWCLPVFAISLITYLTQAEITLPPLSPLERSIVVLDTFGFYLSKIIWPFGLTVDYGRSPAYLLSHFGSQWALSFLFFAVTTTFFWAACRTKNWRFFVLFLSWAFCLLPVSGLISFAFQEMSTVANHYIYFSVAIFSLLLVELLISCAKKLPSVVFIFGIFFLVVCYLTLSWQRLQTWRNPKVFFETMLTQNPKSHSALMGLAQYYGDDENNPSKSLALLEKARLQKPKDILVISNIATTLGRLGRYKEVATLESWLFDPEFQAWMPKRNVDSANFLNALGLSMAPLGRVDLSLMYLCEAQALNPVRPGYAQNAEKILAQLRPKNPQITCPRFLTFNEFIQTASVVRFNQTKESK